MQNASVVVCTMACRAASKASGGGSAACQAKQQRVRRMLSAAASGISMVTMGAPLAGRLLETLATSSSIDMAAGKCK